VLVDRSHTYVFNVRSDLAERNDLAKWRQDVAQDLQPLLVAWEASVDAERPPPPPPAPPAPSATVGDVD
jgi:hypothetical protein